jgi:hypothetical protein
MEIQYTVERFEAEIGDIIRTNMNHYLIINDLGVASGEYIKLLNIHANHVLVESFNSPRDAFSFAKEKLYEKATLLKSQQFNLLVKE